ncbi:MAG: integration host factor subunit beta [Acidobacteriia bacterium]|nr:integration host factor subunit beta [Terriglobia bacterium]
MTKTDLIRNISSAADLTQKDAEVVMETILNAIVRTLRAGEKIEVRGFGSFRIRRRQPRIVCNPKTGARVEVPAKNIAYFTPSKELKAGLAELGLTGGKLR